MTPLRNAINAKNAIKFAIMLATKNTALAAPCAAASNALASVLEIFFLKNQIDAVKSLEKCTDPLGTLMSPAFV